MKFYKIGEHIQKVQGEKITCTCIWMTMEMGRKRNFWHWKECKHIKELREKLNGKI